LVWFVIIGVPGTFAAWLSILANWRHGVLMLLVYVPIGGAISLWMWPNTMPLLFKDILFVGPIYVALFLLSMTELRRVPVPRGLTLTMVLLAMIVLLQLFNPKLDNVMVGVVGAKVWLFYLPLVFVGAVAIRDRDDLVRLLRVIIVIAIVPCAVGLTQWGLSNSIGYRAAIQMFYGAAAAAATQQFGQFDFGTDLFRIPSTFTFIAGYSGFTLSMLVPTYALIRLDPSPMWRRFGRIMLGVVIISALLSGARANFIFVPLLMALILALDARLRGIVAGLLLLPPFLLAILEVSGLHLSAIITGTGTLVSHYKSDLIIPSVIDAIRTWPMGQGSGMNTGAARHVMSSAAAHRFSPVESYYARAIIELGIPGFLVVVSLFGAMVLRGFACLAATTDRACKSCAAALLAYLIVIIFHSLKGWQIDADPVNIYFWLFAGILFKLPLIASEPAANRGEFAQAAGRRRIIRTPRHQPAI
jgi:hypothetical protein